jgi:hypothetical protein
MTIDNLTLGDIKELISLFGGKAAADKQPLGNQYIGKYVIVRSRNEGVNAGIVLELDETGVILEEARRLYYHKPISKSVSWYEGVALEGLSVDSKVGANSTKLIIEDYSLTICTKKAEKSIRGAAIYEQK